MSSTRRLWLDPATLPVAARLRVGKLVHPRRHTRGCMPGVACMHHPLGWFHGMSG